MKPTLMIEPKGLNAFSSKFPNLTAPTFNDPDSNININPCSNDLDLTNPDSNDPNSNDPYSSDPNSKDSELFF